MAEERMIDMPGVSLRLASGTSREYLTLEGKLLALSKKPGLLESYKTNSKNVVKKEVPKGSGNFILYDKNTKKPFNEKAARAQIFKRELGTSTPHKDLKYLRARDELKVFKSRTNQGEDAQGSWQYNVRRHFSDETDVEGVRESDVRVSNKAKALESRLSKLKVGTSFARKETAQTDEALVSSGDKAIAKKLKEVDKATTKLKLDKGVFDPKNQPILDAAASFRHEDLSKYSKILGTELFKGHSSIDSSAFQVTEKGESNKNNLDFKTSLDAEALGTGAKVNKDGEVEIPKKPEKESALIRAARRQSSSKGSVGRNLLRIQELRELSKLENEDNDESEEET